MAFTKKHAERNKGMRTEIRRMLEGKRHEDFHVYSDIHEADDSLTIAERMSKNEQYKNAKLKPCIESLRKKFPDVSELKIVAAIWRAAGSIKRK